METKAICEKCRKMVVLGESSLKQDFLWSDKGDRYHIIYYQCDCGHVNIVQIDDDRLYALYGDLKRLIVKAYKKSRKGETVPKKWQKKRERLNLELIRGRAELKEKLRGTVFRKKDENFSIYY